MDEASINRFDSNVPSKAFVDLAASMSQDEDGDEARVKSALLAAQQDSGRANELLSNTNSFDEKPVDIASVDVPSSAGLDAQTLLQISNHHTQEVPTSVTPQRKDQLLLQARTDRLFWIQSVPLPYRTKESTNHFSRFLHYSHATQQMPSAARILEHLYENDLSRVDALLKKAFDASPYPSQQGSLVDPQLVHLSGNQILENEVNATMDDSETNQILKYYQSFSKRLQDPECAVLVQGMRTFFRNFPDTTESTAATGKLKDYRLAMLETLKQNAAFKGIEENALRRSLESFLFGHGRAHLESVTWTSGMSNDDASFRDKLQALQFVTPVHLDIHCLVTNQVDADSLKLMLAQPVRALQSIDTYHSAYEKLQRILVVYKSVSAALTEALRKNPATANKLPSADDVLPTIILSVVMASPERLAFNLRLVEEMCPPEDLRGEAGYAFANLYGAYQFLSDLDLAKEPSSLSIGKDSFREAIESHRAGVEARQRAMEKPIGALGDAEPSILDDNADTKFPSPHDIRLARTRGEAVDLDWAIQWQAANTNNDGENEVNAGSVVPRSAIEMAEQGLPVGFRRNYSFLTTRADDVRVHDLPQLLDEYRMLVHVTESLLGERVLKKAAERKATARTVERNLMMAARSIDPAGHDNLVAQPK